MSLVITLLTTKSTFAALKPGFVLLCLLRCAGGGSGWMSILSETALCTQAQFQPGSSASVSLLLYLLFMVPVYIENTCLSAAVVFCLVFFPFLLSHCTAHQSSVSFALWSPALVVTSLSAFLLPAGYQLSLQAPVQCCFHGLSVIRVSEVCSSGRICSMLRACYSCDVHILKFSFSLHRGSWWMQTGFPGVQGSGNLVWF